MNEHDHSFVDVIVKLGAENPFREPEAPKSEALSTLKSRAMRHFHVEETAHKLYFLYDRNGKIESIEQPVGHFAAGAHQIEIELVEHSEHHSHDLHVSVSFAGAKDPIKFIWPKTEKIGKAADQAAHAFGIKPDTPPTLQDHKDRVFDRDKTLEQEHVHDHANLELVASGGGV
jgi:hypothetical protein